MHGGYSSNLWYLILIFGALIVYTVNFYAKSKNAKIKFLIDQEIKKQEKHYKQIEKQEKHRQIKDKFL